ncbi:MAG: cystathionine gamma-synthase [Planctomycetota bacterium]|nr:MAG: cystathionine gamma-synthase [Planctomycetota bacterium]
MNSSETSGWKLATRAIHVGQEPDPATGATVPPIHTTSTFTQTSPGKHKGFEYSRSDNPTRRGLERCLASLEGGEACAAFASGSAAAAAVLGTLHPGEKVLAFSDVYGGTFRLLKEVFEKYGIEPVFTDETDPSAFAARLDERTRMVWLESPTNPLLRCLDIAAIGRIAHQAGAKLVVDNTFATPVLQTPLSMGADFVVHSTTKYIGGHSDVIGGAVIVRDRADIERVAFLQNAVGAVPGPFDCYLQHRGIKTLPLRMERHCANAMRVAEFLRDHKAVERVAYPFLPDHPDHDLARRQMCGGGGMVTVTFRDDATALRFCERVKVFSLAESLGGVESLVCHPAIMTHASIPREVREARGVTDRLVRISVGIEDVDDLLADLDQALAR